MIHFDQNVVLFFLALAPTVALSAVVMSSPKPSTEYARWTRTAWWCVGLVVRSEETAPRQDSGWAEIVEKAVNQRNRMSPACDGSTERLEDGIDGGGGGGCGVEAAWLRAVFSKTLDRYAVGKA